MQSRIQNSIGVSDLISKLESGADVHAVYSAGARLQESNRSENESDEEFIQLYQQCQYRGLSIQLNAKTYLDSCLRLSALLFRYGRAIEAENYLLLLKRHPNPDQLPAWVWAYSAKLEYVRNIGLCVQQPSLVLSFLEKSVNREPCNSQAAAVLTEFVLEATKYIKSTGNSPEIKKLFGAVSSYIDNHPEDNSAATKSAVNELFSDPEFLLFLDNNFASDPVSEPKTYFKRIDEGNLNKEALERKIAGLELRLEQIEEENVDLQLQLVEREAEMQDARNDIATKNNQLADALWKLEKANITGSKVKEFQSPQTSDLKKTEKIHEHTSSVVALDIPKRRKILVVGDSQVSENHLIGICKSLGIASHQMKFCLSFDAFKNIDFKSLAYDSNLAGVLIGPVPHKVQGCDDPANVLINNGGFPPTVKIETNAGELKITKASFRRALNALLINLSTEFAQQEPQAAFVRC